MKLATLRTSGDGTTAAIGLGADAFLPLPYPNVGALLADPNWRATVEAATGASDSPEARESGIVSRGRATIDAGSAVFAPLVPEAGKVICCGLNYRDHIQEMGRDLPEYPTLFAKHADTLTGATDTIEIVGSEKVDWEAELAVVVGSVLFQASEEQAQKAIAGYTVANDISMRDWQNRTLQWFQGKAFDGTTPVGPVLVTPEDITADFEVRGYVNGELVQAGNTGTLVFSPVRLLSYISQFTILRPGDLVLTGTPGGVGMGMIPPRFLQDGDVLTTEIAGLGRLENRIRIHTNGGAAASRIPALTTNTKE